MAKRALLLILIICLTAATAYAESVVRELPDEPVGAGEGITVLLTQEGIFFNASTVTEILPNGFVYVTGSYTGSKGKPPIIYDANDNTLIMKLAGNSEISVSYNVTSGTLEQIRNAKFNGTYSYINENLDILEGTVIGDDTLTAGQPPSYDLNGDGTITPVDALIALDMACGNCAPDGNADVSGDDKVTSLDALMLMQVAAKNINI